MSDPNKEEAGGHAEDSPSSRERLIAAAVADYLDLQLRGEIVDVDEFCGAHADLQPELRTEIEALEHIDTVLLCPDAVPTQPSTVLPERLSGHRILGEIGSGGMGRVFLGYDEALGRKVAIKTLSTRYAGNAALRERFMHEARSMARLSHPNVARIYNLGRENEEPHFVMEYLEGTTLIAAARPLTIRQKVELLHKVVLAVEFLHQHQVVHRDLKPGNILVGPDLEPKVLDFGLALQVDNLGKRLTLAGEVMGTPDYISPEQARGTEPVDMRSDVFSLGAMFYELLTGSVPFRGESISEQLRMICDREPVLPRRMDQTIPGELQNICMKALEKEPADRYSTAREMADDLARFLSGEPVLALPSSYARMMSGKIEQHLRELGGWKQDQILSDQEFDGFRRLYERLIEKEDAWIMEVRRLSLPQVSLYLGAWLLVTGGALIVLFEYLGLTGWWPALVVTAAAAPTAWMGIRCWSDGRLRIAIAYLLAFCLLTPITLLVLAGKAGVFASLTKGNEDLELYSKFPAFKKTTNAQLWWALLLSLPAYLWLRRLTRASVFSLVFAVAAALLGLVTLLRLGALEWLNEDPGRVYLHLIPIGILFFVAGLTIERLGYSSDSRYFYPIAVVFTIIALSGVAAFHEPYANWLKSIAPVTRGQIEYLFILNAGIYLGLQYICDRISSPQTRSAAKSFRFVIPGHVMTSLLFLGIAATSRWEESPADTGMRFEARLFELVLPAVACAFVLGSVPKQMKNFFATGLLFLAIGIIRLQQDLFRDRALWPIGLLSAGFLLMLAAANYSRLRMTLQKTLGRESGKS
jgi:predicted Ser/Thr protein kinase